MTLITYSNLNQNEINTNAEKVVTHIKKMFVCKSANTEDLKDKICTTFLNEIHAHLNNQVTIHNLNFNMVRCKCKDKINRQ